MIIVLALMLHGCSSAPTTVPEAAKGKRTAEFMDNWAVFEGTVDGKTIRLRRAMGLEKKSDRAQYPFAATVR
jgi:hypothetical protein